MAKSALSCFATALIWVASLQAAEPLAGSWVLTANSYDSKPAPVTIPLGLKVTESGGSLQFQYSIKTPGKGRTRSRSIMGLCARAVGISVSEAPSVWGRPSTFCEKKPEGADKKIGRCNSVSLTRSFRNLVPVARD
jgi:hypothetical protein